MKSCRSDVFLPMKEVEQAVGTVEVVEVDWVEADALADGSLELAGGDSLRRLKRVISWLAPSAATVACFSCSE